MYISIINHTIFIYVLIRQFSALRAGLAGQGWGSVTHAYKDTGHLAALQVVDGA